MSNTYTAQDDRAGTFSQYIRLKVKISASTKEVVKAAHGRLSKEGKTPAMRKERHDFIKSMLKHHDKARATVV